MPESVVQEEVESLNIHVRVVTQLCSGRGDQDPAKDHFSTPTLFYRWRGGLMCQKWINHDLCGLRVSVESYVAKRPTCNESAASASDTRSVTAVTPPVRRAWVFPSPVGSLPHGSSLSAVAAGATTRRTTGAVSSGKKRRQLLQSKRPSVYERTPAQATSPFLNFSRPGPLPSRWTWSWVESPLHPKS